MAIDFINDYKKRKNLDLDKTEEDETIKAGWTHLHLALEKYNEKIDMMKRREIELYDFSSYFTWFVKQGILEYLQAKYKE